MKLVLSGSLCAADRATTAFRARSLIDCQRRCTTQKNKCYASNFYSDTKTCEMYNFKPTTFTSSRKNCRLFTNYDTGAMKPQTCQIDALSWGSYDTPSNTRYGYVNINGNRVITTITSNSYKGFNTLELNVTSCSASNIKHFNTYEVKNDSNNMATYINSLPLYTVLVGVTAWEASQQLTQNAKSALLAIGVDTTGLGFCCKMSFVAQVGQPAMTVMQIGPYGGNNVKITVNVTGNHGKCLDFV